MRFEIAFKTHFSMQKINRRITGIFKELSINYEIREKEVRLISAEGEQLGIVSIQKAMATADAQDMDLVLLSPQAKPPVCKLMDYKKYRFDAIKREKDEKRKVVDNKEMRLSAVIDKGDLETKAKKTREFIEDGSKVLVSIRMKSRQQAHPELSVKVMEDFFAMLQDVAQMDKKPNQEGRIISMTISPLPNKK